MRGLARYQPGRLGQEMFALLAIKIQYKKLTGKKKRDSFIINVGILATHLITLPGHVNACCVISEICIMCVTSNLHGERFGPKQETKQDGGQGKITLRSFHTKKKKKLKLSLLLEGSQCRAVSNNCFLLDQTIPRKEPVLLDMWNP